MRGCSALSSGFVDVRAARSVAGLAAVRRQAGEVALAVGRPGQVLRRLGVAGGADLAADEVGAAGGWLRRLPGGGACDCRRQREAQREQRRRGQERDRKSNRPHGWTPPVSSAALAAVGECLKLDRNL